MYKYINSDDEIKVGDVFTDGSEGQEDYRLKNRAKVLYVDEFTLVWFPLNEFTQHTDFDNSKNTSRTWCLSSKPIKLSLSDLTDEEVRNYNNV
tara:strand:- start:236 stop:514 length:279 start_codon:yes stop_codon:yes gene_type:complete